MKKIVSILLGLFLLLALTPMIAFASSDIEYIREGIHTGIWYSNPDTKKALDNCELTIKGGGKHRSDLVFNLKSSTIDLYDDLLLTGYHDEKDDNPPYQYYFEHGTIRCHNCRAFNLYENNIWINLTDIHIEDGRAICNDDYDYGYGGAIYVDGAGCAIVDTHSGSWVRGLIYINSHSYIEDCYADEHGGAIAVCGHNCTINGLTFNSNTGYNNGGNDLYVYWGNCHVNGCTFDKAQQGAAANITANTYFDGCNITKKMCIGDLHQVFITNPVASMLSVGNAGIIIGIVSFVTVFFVAILILKKKKASSMSDTGKV